MSAMTIDSGDLESGRNEEEIEFLPERKPSVQKRACSEGSFGTLLSREELLKIDKDEPKWRRIRIVLLVLFWVVWLGLLAASVIIIVFTTKCPPVPSLSFWQSKTGYWLDPFAFKDSGNDLVGDLSGLLTKLDYIKNEVGAGFIILGSFVSGTFSSEGSRLGLVDDFLAVDRALGSIEDFRAFIKSSHRNGLEVVVSLGLNSIATTHKWTNQTSFLRKPISSAVSRDGSDAVVEINGQQFYSVLGNETVDLDLSHEALVSELVNIIEFWLNEGSDGILLTDAAYYVEEDITSPARTGRGNRWFSSFPTGQLFTNGTVRFISKIREIIDKVSQTTGRTRLLAVDAGDYGYGLGNEPDPSLRLLGTADNPAAHLVISRQFTRNRGWKNISPDSVKSSVKAYDDISGKYKDYLALSTATSSDQHHNDFLSLAATFLLPGTPLIYYGAELGIQPLQLLDSPVSLYPKGKVPFPNLPGIDSSVSCHLPMPWDRSGLTFSSASLNESFSAYLDTYGIGETVESATSFGRGTTAFQLVESLIRLRKNPNLLWGDFVLLDLDPSVAEDDVEIFTRRAEGHAATIVALIRKPHFGAAFSFANVCGRVVPKLVYPLNSDIMLDKSVESNRIYLKADTEPRVYVFNCL